MSEAEATVKFAIRNAIAETADVTGLVAGAASECLVDTVYCMILDPATSWAVVELAARAIGDGGPHRGAGEGARMRNRRAALFRPPGAQSREERLNAWRSNYERQHPRPAPRARGYDADWRELRAAHLEEEPFCRHCCERGIERRAQMVDHIVSVRDAPERRLDPTNLQSLCFPCHQRKTVRVNGGFGHKPLQGGGY